MKVVHAELYQHRKAKSICTQCGKLPALPGKTQCAMCTLHRVARTTLGSATHVDIIVNQLKVQNGLCAYTGRPLVVGENLSVEHVIPVSAQPHLIAEPANILLVDLAANRAKMALSLDKFKELISDLYNTLCLNSEED